MLPTNCRLLTIYLAAAFHLLHGTKTPTDACAGAKALGRQVTTANRPCCPLQRTNRQATIIKIDQFSSCSFDPITIIKIDQISSCSFDPILDLSRAKWQVAFNFSRKKNNHVYFVISWIQVISRKKLKLFEKKRERMEVELHKHANNLIVTSNRSRSIYVSFNKVWAYSCLIFLH